MRFGIWGCSGFQVQGLELRGWGLELRVKLQGRRANIARLCEPYALASMYTMHHI